MSVTDNTMVDYSDVIDTTISSYWNIRDDLKGIPYDDIVQYQKSICTNNVSICTLNVTGDLNIGTILRSCVIFGVPDAYIFGRRKYDRRSTVGAQNYLNVNRIDGLQSDGITIDCDKFFTFVEENNFTPILIDYIKDVSINLFWAGLTPYDGKKYLIVFGNEGMGIPEEIINKYPKSVYHIPQKGVLRSLNVGVAAGIALSYFLS
jgi:tRNA G18 (ribose-2'-O)-methylase SpoU